MYAIGILFILAGCAPAPGPYPDASEIERQRQIQEEMERSTAEWAYQQGLQNLNNKNYSEAIYYFRLAIERDAMHLRTYLSLGNVYAMQDNYILAESYYNKVLRYDPESIPAYTALANMQVKMGNYQDALNLYRKLLEFEPGNQFAQQQVAQVTEELFVLHYEQGMAYKEAGDIDLALKEFQKAHSLNPENVEFTVNIGNLFLQQRDYIMAEGYFQQALAQNPSYFPAIVGAGKVQLALKRYNQAIKYFKEGVGIQPGDYEAAELLDQAQSKKVREALPPQYQEIFIKEQVTRGDVAALLMVDLMVENRLQAASQLAIISDITTHWAKPYIIKVVQFGIMELPPDRFFRPNEPISKGELAFVLGTLFKKLFISLPEGSAVSFSDVHQDNEYHDSVIRVYSAGLMYASTDDTFGFLDLVSGEEIMQIFERVKQMLQ